VVLKEAAREKKWRQVIENKIMMAARELDAYGENFHRYK